MSDLWESDKQGKSGVTIVIVIVFIIITVIKFALTLRDSNRGGLTNRQVNELITNLEDENSKVKDSIFHALEDSLNYAGMIERRIDLEYASMKRIYTNLYSDIPDSFWNDYINREEDLKNFAHFADTVTALNLEDKVYKVEAHISFALCKRIEDKLLATGKLTERINSHLSEKEIYDKMVEGKNSGPLTTEKMLDPCLDTMYVMLKAQFEKKIPNLPTNFWDGLTKKEEDLANFIQYYDTVTAKDINERGVKSTGYITYDILQRIEYKLISCGLEESLINTAISREQYVQSLMESM